MRLVGQHHGEPRTDLTGELRRGWRTGDCDSKTPAPIQKEKVMPSRVMPEEQAFIHMLYSEESQDECVICGELIDSQRQIEHKGVDTCGKHEEETE